MPNGLTTRIKRHAEANGIDLIGTTSAEPFVRNGKTIDPKELMSDARSVIVTGFYMKEEEDVVSDPSAKRKGRFSSAYNVRAFTAMEEHYFETIRQFLKKEGFEAVFNKNYRIPDKLAAVRAGLGRYGKNSVVMTKEYGSCVMFVTIVTDAPLNPAEFSMEGAECGQCDACLRACPTGAITAPYKVNRALCITNWLWGLFIPIHLREKQEDRLFGCGECIQVCPKNRKLEPRRDYPVKLEDVSVRPELIPLLTASEADFRKVIASFPLRAGAEVIRGNAIIALGNAADGTAVEALGLTLTHDNPQIRAYSAWALGRIGGEKAGRLLQKALSSETNRSVIEEITQAIHRSDRQGA